MRKFFRAIIIALFVSNIFVTNIYAEPKIKKTYSINLDSLNVNVKQYLTSLVVDDDAKAWWQASGKPETFGSVVFLLSSYEEDGDGLAFMCYDDDDWNWGYLDKDDSFDYCGFVVIWAEN